MPSLSKAWRVMLAVYLAGIAVAVNQAKVPPVMPALIRDLQVDLSTGGWLMSSFAVVGIFLGVPAAWLLARLGARRAGLLALGATALGAVVGALASSPAQLLAARVVEGLGLGVISVVAPAVISQWFAPERRGLPMGVWASWMPVGGFLIYNLAGPLERTGGWPGLWWFGAAFTLAILAIYAAVVSSLPAARPDPDPLPASETGLGRWLFQPASWLLALIFFTFTFAFGAYSTWAPTYLNMALSLDLPAARFDASLLSLAFIPSTLLAGWVLNRTRRRGLVLAAALLLSGLLLTQSFRLGQVGLVAPFFLALGAVGGFIPTAAFTLAPDTMPRPELAGLALGILSVGQSLGAVLGPPAIAALVADGRWAAGVWPLAAAMAVGLASTLLLHRSMRPAAPTPLRNL